MRLLQVQPQKQSPCQAGAPPSELDRASGPDRRCALLDASMPAPVTYICADRSGPGCRGDLDVGSPLTGPHQLAAWIGDRRLDRTLKPTVHCTAALMN
ncbi:hypothetical protein ES708_25661 [subsurface metagenome]